MTVRVRYFAILRDRRGLAEESVVIESTTAREFADHLTRTYRLGLPASLVRVAVNGEFVVDTHPLADGDEVVLIPPVAGG